MQHKLLHESDGQRTFVVVLETGEEIVASLQKFAASENVSSASFTAIGALSDAVLLYFDWEKKDYQKIPVREQVEVASLIGDVADDPDGKPGLHIHVVLGTRDGSARAGHLSRGAYPAHAGSRADRKSGSSAQGQGQGNWTSADPTGRLAPMIVARNSSRREGRSATFVQSIDDEEHIFPHAYPRRLDLGRPVGPYPISGHRSGDPRHRVDDTRSRMIQPTSR